MTEPRLPEGLADEASLELVREELRALDGDAGPARPLPAAALDALAASAVERAFPVALTPGARRSAPRWAVVAAVLACTGAAAAFVAGQRLAPRPAAPAAVPSSAAPAEPARGPGATRSPDARALPAPSVEDARAASPAPPPEPAAAPVASELAPPPEDLLRAANQLRQQGRWREAERAYGRVMERYPGTATAYVARVAAASLRLDHLGDPAGALALYRGALAGGALGEEALLGTARCHRALGDRASEAATLRRLLAAHPRSLLAAQASARLAELEGRTQ